MTDFLKGPVTFLFSDLVGSTRLWEEHPGAMHPSLAVHDEILKASVRQHNGRLVKTTGDGIHAAFEQPTDAVEAAMDAQAQLSKTDWGEIGSLTVRMGIHTGEATFRDGDYYGPVLNRAARVMSLAHGGQVLLSNSTYLLVSENAADAFLFKDLGFHALRGLSGSERLYQVCVPGLQAEFPPLFSGESIPHNLPEQLSSFVGRESELETLTAMLSNEELRLVTLTGPGGTGKTRLSVEVAKRVLDSYQDGIFFVQLAPIADPELVPTTIARTIGLREGGGLPPLENLKTYLHDRRVLLVLDNLEQVVGAAGILSELLASVPGLTILASSRIPLQVTGEQEFFLPPLQLPGPDASLQALESAEAVKLFLERARSVRPQFQITSENAHAIVEICRRLDGLPLALEIAAARLRIMTPQAILKRLENSLDLLTRVSRDLPERQQTMRAAIDWSYKLLEPDNQRLFARLGVFAGSFTFEAAETVCNSEGAVDLFTVLETLVSNSLLRTTPADTDEPRFDMLKTIRDYAREKLEAQGELEAVRAHYARYFADRSQEIVYDLFSSRANELLDWLELEIDNFRAALSYGTESPEHAGLAAQIAANIFWFWYRRGHFHEGYEWTLKTIQPIDPHSQLLLAGNVLVTAGMMAMWIGDLEAASAHAQQGLELLRKVEEPWPLGVGTLSNGIIWLNRGEDTRAHPLLEESVYIFRSLKDGFFEATTMVHLANAALGLGKTEEARSWLEQARVLADKVGDPWLIAFAANNLGEVARVERDFELARPYYEETSRQYALADAKGDQARLVHTFGYLEMHAGDLDKAEALFRESLSMFLELGNKRGIAECLAGIAGLAVHRGQVAWGAPLLAAAEKLLTSFGGAWWPADRVEIEAFKQEIAAAGVDFAGIQSGPSLQNAVQYAFSRDDPSA